MYTHVLQTFLPSSLPSPSKPYFVDAENEAERDWRVGETRAQTLSLLESRAAVV